MQAARFFMRFLGILAVAGMPSAGRGETLFAAPSGRDDAPGTRAAPLSLRRAVARASEPEVVEIVLLGGEYEVDNLNIRAPLGAPTSEGPELVVRAASPGDVVFRHSVHVPSGDPVAGMPGVYRTALVPPGEPNLWERDTRIRYVELATLDSVGAFPASCYADPEEGALYFHTSDGQPPTAHRVWFGLGVSNGRALGIYRSNTTIAGVTFRDCIGLRTHALVLNAANLTARDCRFENCDIGVGLGTSATDNVIADCRMHDVAQGIRHLGKDLIVRGCRFVKVRDRFLYRVYPALDTGIYTYFPGSGTTVVDCFIQGYLQGIRVKAAPGRYRLRHNTIVDCTVGIWWVTDNAGSDTSYNIIVNAQDFIRVSRFDPGIVLDHNLFWEPRDPVECKRRTEVIRGANLGKFNTLADPRFADPARGVFTLLPDSPALDLADIDGRPAGAFGAGSGEAAASAAPTRELAFAADTVPYGAHGEETFDRDPWNGGGTTSVRTLVADADLPRRLTGQPQAVVAPRAFDTPGAIVETRVRMDAGPAVTTPYSPLQTIELPDRDGEYRVRIEVRNDRGVWSEPAEALLRLDRRPPALRGEPLVLANAHGLIVTFETDEPCFAELHFGSDPANAEVAKMPPYVKRCWESQDGGERVETWTLARRSFAIPLLPPAVKSGSRVQFRIVLRDEGGLKSESADFAAWVRGEARELFVSPAGDDAAGRGARLAPLRTLQYAVDRALPGETVRLLPGVYTQYTLVTHGGLSAAAPITITSDRPGTVILDSAYREPSLIAVEQASHVVIRGLRFLAYRKAGVYAYKSEHITVDGCTFYNGAGAARGFHVFMFYSPHATVTRCLAVGAEIGLQFLKSPYATVTHNTISQGLYAAVRYDYSLEGTVQMNNSLCFAGNDVFCGCWAHPDELKTFHSDYNNLGTSVLEHNRNRDVARTPAWDQVLAENFKAEYGTRRFPFQTGSKAVVGIGAERYLTLAAWRAASGQDLHSIFADPQYVKPVGVIDRWDWRIRATSPNIGVGKGGSTIGALGAAEE